MKKKFVAYLFIILGSHVVYAQQAAQTSSLKTIDSLLHALKSLPTNDYNSKDTVKVKILFTISDLYSHSLFDYENALQYALQAAEAANKTNKKIFISVSLRKIGNIYYHKWLYEKAIEYYLASLKVAEEINDRTNIANSLNNIGNVYSRMAELSGKKSDYGKALEYHLHALELRKKDKENITHSLLNIHTAYLGLKQYQKAINYLKEARIEYAARKDPNGVDLAQISLGEIYLDWAKQTGKQEYFTAAEKCFNERPFGKDLESARSASVLISIGEMRLIQNRLDEAIGFLTHGVKTAEKTKELEALKSGAYLLSDALKKRGNYQQALEYHKLFRKLKDSLLSEKANNHITELNTRYETEKKEKDIELLKKDKALQQSEMDRQKFVLYGFIGGLILVLLLIFILFNRFTVKRKLNIQLDITNKDLLQKNILIEKQQEKIVNSLVYARLMQQKIVIEEQEVQKLLPDSFTYYQPKDIVSGDFYWCSKINGKIILVVTDCTGHGVPGAFMSIIGNTLLNQIIKQKHITTPSEILNHLNNGIYDILNQNKEKPISDDGMDISICCIDYENNRIEYSGAQQPLYIIANNQLTIIKADIYTIGGRQFLIKPTGSLKVNYTNHTFPITPNMSIYLFTDGYPDQFGGKKRKKFSLGKFQELLLSSQELNMEEQGNIIIKAHEEWKGNTVQIDDILVVGVKIK